VYNEKNEKVGVIDDLIIAPDRAVTYAIVGAGGFVGLAKHDVAIPVSQLKQQDGKFVIPGASKEAIKAMPKLESAARYCGFPPPGLSGGWLRRDAAKWASTDHTEMPKCLFDPAVECGPAGIVEFLRGFAETST